MLGAVGCAWDFNVEEQEEGRQDLDPETKFRHRHANIILATLLAFSVVIGLRLFGVVEFEFDVLGGAGGSGVYYALFRLYLAVMVPGADR